MRVCLFSEGLAPPFDEGIKNVAVSLASSLAAGHECLILTKGGQDSEAPKIKNVAANRFLLGRALQRQLSGARPDLVIYVPTACATLASFVRARTLRYSARGARTILLILQPRPYGRIARKMLRVLARNVVVVALSPQTRNSLQALGCQAELWAPGVDLRRFSPVANEEKERLRQRYGLPFDARIVLHVGHINAGRGIEILEVLQGRGTQVLLVGSTHTAQDQALARKLETAGCVVIRECVPQIEDIYRLADCYLFMTMDKKESIEVPLSVLEAMSCNLPVITTPFGGLPALFAEGGGLFYFAQGSELGQKVRDVWSLTHVNTRMKVLSYDWTMVSRRLAALASGQEAAS